MDEFDLDAMLTEAAFTGDDDEFEAVVALVMEWSDGDIEAFWSVVENSSASSGAVMEALARIFEEDAENLDFP